MQNDLVPKPVSSSDMSTLRPARDTANCLHQCTQECRTDHQFVAMLNSYRGSGGLAREQEVVALFKRRYGPDRATLASWIVEREVICFEWQSQTWLPWFQFNRFDMAPQPELDQVFAELTSVYDPWELANWFARPNPWLADRTPVDTLVYDLPVVVHAARADRLIANG